MKLFGAYFKKRGRTINSKAAKLAPLPEGVNLRLWYVMASEGHHIPISCYVFAVDGKDAIERVKGAAESNAKTRTHDGKRFLRFGPSLTWEAERCPTDIVLEAGQAWAGNSGFTF